MLWGSADVWYESKTKSDAADANDTLRGEIYPIGVQYKGERLTVQTEIRHTLHNSKEYKEKTPYKVYDDFGRTRVYLKNNYKVNESLNVYFNYAYEFRDWEAKDGTVNTDSDRYFGDIVFGWNYKF